MKSIRSVITALLIMIAMNGTVCAAERAGIEAGINLWYNDWSREMPGFNAITSEPTVLIGPVIHVKLGNGAFAEASSLAAGTDYRFTSTVPTAARATERRDVCFAAGYKVVPEISVLAGYKNILLKDLNRETKTTLAGPFIEMRAAFSVEWNLAFYITANALFTTFKQSGPTGAVQEKSPGWSYEFGFRRFFTRRYTGTIGYKVESYTGRDSNKQNIFSGFTLGGMLNF